LEKEEEMTEGKKCGTRALGLANYELHNEAQEWFAKLGFIDRWRVLVGERLTLGMEQRRDWRDELPFYLFKCENDQCGRIAKDYPHGYIHRQYLLCSACGEHHDFVPWWVEFVMLWDSIRFAVRLRRMKKTEQKK
jgi:hypothetical protein